VSAETLIVTFLWGFPPKSMHRTLGPRSAQAGSLWQDKAGTKLSGDR
jgi:hypothetical protein